jgi:hypothetical protein
MPSRGACEEVGLVEQVAGVVARQREFREDDQVGLRGGGVARGHDHLGDVAGDVADHVVQLGDGDLEHGGVPQAASGATWNTWRR